MSFVGSRVAATTGRALAAYRAYVIHAQDCAACEEAGGGRCAAAKTLWAAYKDARR